MPRLKVHGATRLVHRVGYFPPRLDVLMGDHERRPLIIAASPIYKSALIDDQAGSISGPVSVMLDLRWAGLVVVDATVSCQGRHHDSVLQDELPADSDGVE